VVFRRRDHRHSLPHRRGPKPFLRALHCMQRSKRSAGYPNPTSGPVPC
jgi:hypothetical protein